VKGREKKGGNRLVLAGVELGLLALGALYDALVDAQRLARRSEVVEVAMDASREEAAVD
jgi:hypothetical protein